MKTKSSLKNIFFTILVVIGVNTTQIYTLYQTRKFGSINFFAIEDHVFGLFTCLLAFISSYLSWQIISKKQFKNTQKIILSLLNQIGWKSRIQSIITENDLTDWYEKALRGKYGEQIGEKMLQILSNEIKVEFPVTENIEFARFYKGRGYDKLTDTLWDK